MVTDGKHWKKTQLVFYFRVFIRKNILRVICHPPILRMISFLCLVPPPLLALCLSAYLPLFVCLFICFSVSVSLFFCLSDSLFFVFLILCFFVFLILFVFWTDCPCFSRFCILYVFNPELLPTYFLRISKDIQQRL